MSRQFKPGQIAVRKVIGRSTKGISGYRDPGGNCDLFEALKESRGDW